MINAGVKAIQWGVEMEPTALRSFQEHKQLTVKPTGLWLHHSGILGASPDGMVPEVNAIVEVKCPYSARDKTISEACELKDFCLQSDTTGTLHLRDNHNYHDQIQAHYRYRKMFFCGLYYQRDVHIGSRQR